MKVLCTVLLALSLAPVNPARSQLFTDPVYEVGVWKDLTPAAVNLKATGNDHTFVQGVSLDPRRPSTIYLCVCSFNAKLGGLYKTENGGTSWNKIGPLDEPLHIEINPANSNSLYAVDGVRGATLGFWKSSDGGVTWVKPASFDAAAKAVGTPDLYSLAVDPTDFNHVLVSFHNYWTLTKGAGLLETKDGGETWKIIPPPVPGAGVGSAIFFLFDPVKGIGNKNTWLMTTQAGGYYRTTDAGQTWSMVTNAQMTHGGAQLYRAPNGTLYTGGYQYPSRSTDNGATWTILSKNGLTYGWYMGVTGAEGKIFTGPLESPLFTTPDTDGLKWTVFETKDNKSFNSYPFEMKYDATKYILYSAAWSDGLWAIKLRAGLLPIPLPPPIIIGH